MEFVEFIKAYKEFGYFGLWLLTMWLFYRDMNAKHKEQMAITIQTTIALDKSTAAINSSTDTQQRLKEEMQSLKTGNQAFMEFLRGRDSRQEHGK